MNPGSIVDSPTDKDVPDVFSPVFHPTILYPVLVKVGDGNVMVEPIVMSLMGRGAVPCVLSVLNNKEYLTADHFGYSVTVLFDPKQSLMMSDVIDRDPEATSIPVPSEDVFHTVAE